MSAEGELYEGNTYNAPGVIEIVGKMLRGLRGKYNTAFAQVFSPDPQEQSEYINGLLAVLIAFIILVIFWVFILATLKFKGSDVGCASGNAFVSKHIDSNEIYEEDNFPSTDESESMSSKGSKSRPQRMENEDHLENNRHNGSGDQKLRKQMKISGSFCSSSNTLVQSERSILAVNPREKRTRVCFILFTIAALSCIPIIMAFAYGPLKDAAENSSVFIFDIRDVLSEASKAGEAIELAMETATETYESALFDIDSICSNVAEEDILEIVGVDLSEIVNTITRDYDSIMQNSSMEFDSAKKIINGLSYGVTSFEDTVAEAEEWIWIVPAVLFVVSIVTTAALVGVLLAWKGTSDRRTQSTMSFIVLPSMMVVTAVAWILVLCSALGTMLGSDMCTTGTSTGSPDDTIQQILSLQQVGSNTTLYRIVNGYTNQCSGESPTQGLDDLRQTVQGGVDFIWRQISIIDSIGRTQIMEKCGGDGLESLLFSIRNLAKDLTVIRRSLDNLSTEMACARINAIYTTATHDTICTEGASAAAYGFIFFFLLATSLMVMMTLRASWLQNIKEEKIYHDEDEVAENMILDEHEEYLAYISRYKHEWQEYGGIEDTSIARSNGVGHDEEEGSYFEGSEYGSQYYDDDGEGYNGSEEGSYDGSNISHPSFQVSVCPANKMDIIDGGDANDAISLPMLDEQKSHVSNTLGADDFFKLNSPVPPPSSNPEYREDKESGRNSPKTIPHYGGRSEDDRRKSPTSDNNKTKNIGDTGNEKPPPNPTREQQLASFFERYGIKAGLSVRKKSPTAFAHPSSQSVGSAPSPQGSSKRMDASDPPAHRLVPRLPTPPSTVSHRHNGIPRSPARSEPSGEYQKHFYRQGGSGSPSVSSGSPSSVGSSRRKIAYSRGTLPSGRTFFKAESSGNSEEVEVQLTNSAIDGSDSSDTIVFGSFPDQASYVENLSDV